MNDRMTSAEFRAMRAGISLVPADEKPAKPKRKNIDREGPIQRACHGALIQDVPDDCVYLSIPNEQVGGKGRGGKLNAMGRKKGAADYWIYYQGVMTFIEFKCPADVHGPKTYLKAEQKDFRDVVTLMPNTRYAVCRSIEEFALIVKPIGLMLKYRIQNNLGRLNLDDMDIYRLEHLQS